MGVYRFEDLRVWQAAKRHCDHVGQLIKRPEFIADDAISDQMNRASVSVMLNVCEGFLRRKDKETLQFLRYAFASNGEVKSAYYASEGRHYITGAEAADLMRLNESIARMLRRWQSTLDSPENREPRGRTSNQGRTESTPNRESGPTEDQ